MLHDMVGLNADVPRTLLKAPRNSCISPPIRRTNSSGLARRPGGRAGTKPGHRTRTPWISVTSELSTAMSSRQR